MNLKIKTRNGFISELRDVELIEVDGVPLGELNRPDATSIENRLQMIEQVLANVIQTLDDHFSQKEIQDIPEENIQKENEEEH